MVILTEGANRIRDLLNTNIDRGQFGTGTTSEEITDTAIETGVSNTLTAVGAATTAANFLEETHEISSTLGNDNTLTEHTFLRASDSRLVSRSIFRGITKQDTFEFRTRTRWFIE